MREIERWKDVQGYESIYQVSNFGRIKRLAIKKQKGTGKYARTEYFKKPSKSNNGYLIVDLYKENKRRQYLLHRLVAIAFIPNPKNLPCVNHKDENKHNSNVNNLEWCTKEYNNDYGINKGRVSKMGKTHGKRIFQLEKKSGRVIQIFPSALQAQRKTGIRNISECCSGKRKTAGGFIWKH